MSFVNFGVKAAMLNCERRLQIAQWLSSRYSLLSPISEEALQKLDDELLTRTFLLGTSLTLADLVLFGVLHPALVNILMPSDGQMIPQARRAIQLFVVLHF